MSSSQTPVHLPVALGQLTCSLHDAGFPLASHPELHANHMHCCQKARHVATKLLNLGTVIGHLHIILLALCRCRSRMQISALYKVVVPAGSSHRR